jgi:exodeoxyribonuclease VII large subunit
MSTLRLCQKLDNMSPKLLIDRNQFLLNSLNKRLARVTNALSTESARKLSSLTARFQALSPKHTLQRGYSILRDPSDGRLLPNVGSIRKGQTLEAEMTDGWVECIVKNANRYHPRATAIRDSKQTRTKSK